jgi:predicted adenine nucleotide alpha hydrolase (AANH) superfamily ATPase
MLRALRDHLADALSTLPSLLEQEQAASLHFYFANLNSMRKHMYPALLSAYRQWYENGNIKPLTKQVEQGRDHWQSLAENALELYRERGTEAREGIETLLENSIL